MLAGPLHTRAHRKGVADVVVLANLVLLGLEVWGRSTLHRLLVSVGRVGKVQSMRKVK